VSGRRRSAGAGRTHRSAPSAQPIIPGQPCPAVRSNKAYDPAVTGIKRTASTEREGIKRCGKCHAIVRVTQAVEVASGAPLQAWHYDRHNVPA
jgi:hypothetical protein